MNQKFELSEEQKEIISYDGNTVVLANPGSGKTTTMSYKIKEILSKSKYKGVIAISYTNKASEELKTKVKGLVEDIKFSYFGTIDKFYIVEIIRPFGRDLIKTSVNKYEVKNLEKEETNEFKQKSKNDKLKFALKQLENGYIILQATGILGNYIFENSIRCKKYILARYSHIVIDEFQDCNLEQYDIFLKFVNSGLIGIGVGDPNQSIFRYDNRDSKYLTSLVSLKNFKGFVLNKNHRCHQSIIEYSLSFLSPEREVKSMLNEDKRVTGIKILGNEQMMAKRIENIIEPLKKRFGIANNKDVAILVRNNNTGQIISKYLKIKNKIYLTTPLDEGNTIYDSICKDLLLYIVGDKSIFLEKIFEKYENGKIINFREKKKIQTMLIAQKEQYAINGRLGIEKEEIKNILKLITKEIIEDKDLENFKKVIDNENMFESLLPLEADTVPIMTIHKSKGLEFDLIFHLDLHNYILPKIDFDSHDYLDIEECKNIHYVAITRAKKAVVLCYNTIRTNSKGEEKNGVKSDFINEEMRPELKKIRNEKSQF